MALIATLDPPWIGLERCFGIDKEIQRAPPSLEHITKPGR